MTANFGASFWQSEALWPAGWYFFHCWCSQIIGFIDSSLRIRSWNVIQRVKLWNSEQSSKNSRSCFGEKQKPHNEQPTHNELRRKWTKHFNVIFHGGDLPADSARSYLLSVVLPLFWAKKLHYRQLVLFYVAVWSENSTYLFGAYICHLATAMLFGHHLTAA